MKSMWKIPFSEVNSLVNKQLTVIQDLFCYCFVFVPCLAYSWLWPWAIHTQLSLALIFLCLILLITINIIIIPVSWEHGITSSAIIFANNNRSSIVTSFYQKQFSESSRFEINTKLSPLVRWFEDYFLVILKSA